MSKKTTKTVVFTTEELKLLKELLSLDLEKIGFNDKEIDILVDISKKIK